MFELVTNAKQKWSIIKIDCNTILTTKTNFLTNQKLVTFFVVIKLLFKKKLLICNLKWNKNI